MEKGSVVTVSCLPIHDFGTSSPGRGREVGSWTRWRPVEKFERSRVWLFRGALQEEGVFSEFLQLETG